MLSSIMLVLLCFAATLPAGPASLHSCHTGSIRSRKSRHLCIRGAIETTSDRKGMQRCGALQRNRRVPESYTARTRRARRNNRTSQ